MTIHCPTCDRSSDQVRFFGEFCEFCTIDRLSAKIPAAVKLQRCRLCSRLKIGADYFTETKQSLAEAIERSLHNPSCKAKVRSFGDEGAVVSFACEFGDETVHFEKTLQTEYENKTCLMCVRKSAGYYEGVVQFRGEAEKVGKFVRRLAVFADRRGSFVAKEEKVQNGWDCYVGEKTIANEFMAYYRIKPKISYTLYGMKNGKRLYRHIYSVRV